MAKRVWIFLGALILAIGVIALITQPMRRSSDESKRATSSSSGDGLGSNSEPDDISLRLTWLHQGQFAGVYCAQDQGFYSDANLNVSIKPGGIEYSSIKMVSSGTDDVGMTSADQVLMARARGVPVVALAAMYQKSPVAIFSLAEDSIIEPGDLRGKVVGIKYGDNTEVPIRALLAKSGLTSSDFVEKPVSYDPIPLIEGNVDALPGFAINEPLSLEEKGYELNLIYAADYGINFYADVIFTREDVLDEKGDAIQRFVQATIKGYEYAINDIDSAVQATLAREPNADAAHERNMIMASIPLWKPEGELPLGGMEMSNWKSIDQTLRTTTLPDGETLLESPTDLDIVVRPAQGG